MRDIRNADGEGGLKEKEVVRGGQVQKARARSSPSSRGARFGPAARLPGAAAPRWCAQPPDSLGTADRGRVAAADPPHGGATALSPRVLSFRIQSPLSLSSSSQGSPSRSCGCPSSRASPGSGGELLDCNAARRRRVSSRGDGG
jgi:hypothetical protein